MARAARQARQLLRAGIGEMRQARPRHDRNAPQQPLQDAAHGGGAEQQRLLAAAQMQDAVGEDVAALEIAGELHLVDRDEGGVGLARHRLDRADRIARAGRHDLLLAGDQRHLVRADLLADARIDLARQQPQRQADDAALMRHHALDGEMRLAGVGRPENRRHVAPGQDEGVGVFGLDVHRKVRRPFWLDRPDIGPAASQRTQADAGRDAGLHPAIVSPCTPIGESPDVVGNVERVWNESATNH